MPVAEVGKAMKSSINEGVCLRLSVCEEWRTSWSITTCLFMNAVRPSYLSFKLCTFIATRAIKSVLFT